MKQQGLFKVRDLRKKTQFKIDDEYINGWARFCGANATLVYTSLCRHAEFYSQKAFPSQKKIAFELGISIASVKRGIKQLVEYNIIKIEKEKMRGKFDNNLYYLLDKSEWIKPTTAPQEPRLNRSSKTVAHRPYTVRDTLKDNKELRIQIKKDNKENAKASFAGKEINEIIDLFKNVNPSYEKFFRNTTQRGALERLVKKFGPGKVEEIISILPITNTKKYAPTITTPLQLEDKLGQLVAFTKQQKSESILGRTL